MEIHRYGGFRSSTSCDVYRLVTHRRFFDGRCRVPSSEKFMSVLNEHTPGRAQREVPGPGEVTNLNGLMICLIGFFGHAIFAGGYLSSQYVDYYTFAGYVYICVIAGHSSCCCCRDRCLFNRGGQNHFRDLVCGIAVFGTQSDVLTPTFVVACRKRWQPVTGCASSLAYHGCQQRQRSSLALWRSSTRPKHAPNLPWFFTKIACGPSEESVLSPVHLHSNEKMCWVICSASTSKPRNGFGSLLLGHLNPTLDIAQ